MFKKIVGPVASVVGSMAVLLSPAAQAAAVDVSSTVTDIGAQVAPVGLIGGAVLLLVVAIKAFHWVRRALS